MMKSSPYSRRSALMEEETDPYNPAIVHELLMGTNEWINIQDIVKLTFKALFDVVKAQGEAIRELERTMPTKASKSEINSGLSTKANISDVSRTVAEVATNIESRATLEDVQVLLGDKVNRSDLQYILSNKVSIDELRTMLENKASSHETKQELRSLGNRVEEVQRDLQMRVSNCSSVKEIEQLSALLDQKSNITDVNEGLAGKANKQSVANALHRKANRADIDALLMQKAEIDELQKVEMQVDRKADISELKIMQNILENKADGSEVTHISRQLPEKADKSDIDLYVNAVQTQKIEQEARIREMERQINSLLASFHEDMDNVHNTISEVMSKKAEGEDLESLVSIVGKKADLELLEEKLSDIISDMNTLVGRTKTEMEIGNRQLEEDLRDRTRKVEFKGDQIADDIFKVKDVIKTMGDTRKSDIDETMRYVRTIAATQKQDLEQENRMLVKEMGNIQREVEDMDQKKCDKREVLDTKSKLISLLEPKVDLSEVQSALTDCQGDLAKRLGEFKDEVRGQFRNQEDDLYIQLEKKASVNHVNNLLSQKADKIALTEAISLKPNIGELEALKLQSEKLSREVEEKVDLHDLDTHINYTKGAVEDINKELLMKSSVKDVCALLDMKANIDDVNKALSEIHKDLDGKAHGEELTGALNDQALINEALCSENCVARWIWKSGEVKNGYAVPWEIQSVNTCPDNFLWEKDKTSVLTVAPGLYEVPIYIYIYNIYIYIFIYIY